MTTFTDREAKDQLSSVLDKATAEGEVRIKREDGSEFIVKPATRSELDVGFVDVKPSMQEVVDAVRSLRERE